MKNIQIQKYYLATTWVQGALKISFAASFASVGTSESDLPTPLTMLTMENIPNLNITRSDIGERSHHCDWSFFGSEKGKLVLVGDLDTAKDDFLNANGPWYDWVRRERLFLLLLTH